MEMPSDLAIETVGLVKAFGKNTALDDLNLAVPRGGVYGFLGPNGAGKTTTIRILATLLKADWGDARVLGFDVRGQDDQVRRRISLTGQFASVDDDLTVVENLIILARLLGYSKAQARQRTADLVEAFGIAEHVDQPAKALSGGLKRRLDIAASILARPELLFLDEPTTGLDPASRKAVWSLVREIVNAGTTVLLTTQYLEEADQLANRIAVIDKGTITAEGSPAELKRMAGAGVVRVELRDPEQQDEARRRLEEIIAAPMAVDAATGILTAGIPASSTSQDSVEQLAHAVAELSRAGVAVTEFAVSQPTLDEVFLHLTDHGTRETDREAATRN